MTDQVACGAAERLHLPVPQPEQAVRPVRIVRIDHKWCQTAVHAVLARLISLS